MLPETAAPIPEWFLPYLQRIDDFCKVQLNIEKDIEEIRREIAELKKSSIDQQTLSSLIDKIQPSIEQQTSLVESLSKRVYALEESDSDCFVSTLCTRESIKDKCEVLLSGLPMDLAISNEVMVAKVTKAVGLPSLSNHVIAVQEWKPKRRTSPSSPHTGPAGRAVVLKMASSATRDQLVANSYKLASRSLDSIFASGGSGQLCLLALWPKPIYENLKLARETAKRLGRPKPVVRNMRIFGRESADSPLVPLDASGDFLTYCRPEWKEKSEEASGRMDTRLQDLNDDCLIHVLSYLPILDRFRADRVCKRWRELNRVAWHSTKSLSLQRDFWGLRSDSRFIVDRNVFKRLLEICGRYVLHVDLSRAQKDGLADSNIRIKSCKYVFTVIRELCPNVRFIDAGAPISDCTLEYVSEHFDDLKHFAVRISNSLEDPLMLIFRNNRTLRSVRLEGCRLSGQCLLELNPETLEEFHFVDSSVEEPQHLINALESFKNVHTLTLSCISVLSDSIDSVLEAIRKNATRVRRLTLKFYPSWEPFADCSFIADHVNLEELRLNGNMVATDYVLSLVGANCKKLRSLWLENSLQITDMGIECVTRLPELWHLHLDSVSLITDRNLSKIPELRTLEISRCPKITGEGLEELLASSRSILALRCVCCSGISAGDLIEAALRRKESENLIVTIDNSEDHESEFVTDVQSLFKADDLVVRKIRKFCYDCLMSRKQDCSVCCDSEDVL